MPSTIHQGELVTPPGALAAPPRAPYPQETPPAEPSLSLRDFFDILRRRKLVALNVFVLVVALGVAVTLMTKPTYRTGARLLIEGRSNTVNVGNSDDPLNSVLQPRSGHDIDTQIEILRSPLVLDRVFKKSGVSPGDVTLDVQRVDRTDVIDLTATSHSREAAEKFIKELPLVYEEDTRQDRLREVTASLNFAQRTLAQQQGKLQNTERALEQFKNRSGVVNTTSEATDAISALSQSRADLAKAEQDDARAQAQLDAQKAQRAGVSRFIVTPITTTNPLVQQLSERLADLLSERNKKLFLFKPTDDVIRQLDLQIGDLQRRLATTPPTITTTSRAPNPAVAELDARVGEARANASAARQVLVAQRGQVKTQSAKLGRFNPIERKGARLQRDLASSSEAVASFTKNVMTLTLRKTSLEAQGAPVTTMKAGGPAEQIAPRLSRNLLAALFLGALLACGAALLQESLDDHIRDEEEARRLLNTSTLGYFPLLPAKARHPVLNLESPDRALLETFRVLRSNVQFALVNSPGQKLLVTSSVPGEGKSYIASNLAIAMALAGRTVILVDTDLHRPSQHTIFGVERYPGLTNVLVGDAKLRDCVQEVGIPGMRLISAGVTPPNPAELLSSAVMDAVIERLGKGADVVIFDSPPLLATADSQVLSSKVDGVIVVMQLGRVPRSATKRAFELLRQSRAHVIGLVFNQIDKKSGDSYGNYYDTDYSADLTTQSDNGSDGAPDLGLGRTGTGTAGALLTRPRGVLQESVLKTNGTSNGTSAQNGTAHPPDDRGDNGAL